MQGALRAFVALFGAACVAIALTHIFVGPSSIPGSIPVNPTMDSEDRFYATLFLGFGASVVRARSGGTNWAVGGNAGGVLPRGRGAADFVGAGRPANSNVHLAWSNRAAAPAAAVARAAPR